MMHCGFHQDHVSTVHWDHVSMIRPQDHVSMMHWDDCQGRRRPLEAEKRRIRRRSSGWASAKSGHRPSRRPGGEAGETGGTGETVEKFSCGTQEHDAGITSSATKSEMSGVVPSRSKRSGNNVSTFMMRIGLHAVLYLRSHIEPIHSVGNGRLP